MTEVETGSMIDADVDEAQLLPMQLWVKVLVAVNSVLEGHKYYGFAHFDTYADPSIDVILERAKLVDQMLDLVIDSKFYDDDPWVNNLLVNIRQSIHLIERTQASLKNGDQQEYESCISKLSTQRQH